MNKKLQIEKTINMDEKTKIHVIKQCPFSILDKGEMQNFICIGKNIAIQNPYKNMEDAKKRLEQTDLELIGAMIINYFEYLKKLDKTVTEI
jgi:hypothetical protein